jgi:ABC-2 type transport system permease protein
MSRILVIARRELLSAAVSPVIWLTVAVAWLLVGLAAYFKLSPAGVDTSAFVFQTTGTWLIIQILLVPMLSMRVLSEEKRSGTLEALMTAPVADHEVVLGKYLALSVIHGLAAAIVPLATLPFVLQGKVPDPGQVLSSFLASLGIGAMLLAIGVFASALASAQVLAAFVTILIESALIFGPGFARERLLPENLLAQALKRGDIIEQLLAGGTGVLDLNHFAYQGVIAALFLLYAVRTLEVRKWK